MNLNASMTWLDIYLVAACAVLTGLIIGWFLATMVSALKFRRINRLIEKSGVWRCEDRGYYLIAQNRTLHKQSPAVTVPATVAIA